MTIKELWDDIKAWWRKEERVVPHGIRGRVYADKDPERRERDRIKLNIDAGMKPKAHLQMKVTRADGTVETIEVPAGVQYIDKDGNLKVFDS